MRRLDELDGLRALLALWVFMSHVGFISGAWPFNQGGLAVTVFIMISGYAITSSLLNSRLTYGQYMTRRALRLYPIYLVGLAVGVMTWPLHVAVVQGFGFVQENEVATLQKLEAAVDQHFLSHLFAHLTLLHGAVPDRLLWGSSLAFNGPAWSLSLEWQFYLFAPLIVWLLVTGSKARRILSVVALVAVALVGAKLFARQEAFLPAKLGYFLIGILTAIYLPELLKRPAAAAAAAAALLIVIVMQGRIAPGLPIVVWCAAMLAATIKGFEPLEWVSRLLRWKPLVSAGEASYGFYILHMPVLLMWAWLVLKVLRPTSKYVFAAELLLCLPILLVVAALSFRYFESPIIEWSKTRFRRRAVAADAGAA